MRTEMTMNNGDEREIPKDIVLDDDHGLQSKASRGRITVAKLAFDVLTAEERRELIDWLKGRRPTTGDLK